MSLRNVPGHSARRPGGVTRREFLDQGAHLALGLGALKAGLGRVPLLNGLGFPDMGENPALSARAAVTADDFTLGNDAITAVWSITGGVFRPIRFSDGVNAAALPVPVQCFALTLADKRTIVAGDMRITSPPRTEILAADPRASRLAERIAGRAVTLTLQDASGKIEAVWRGVLRDGSNYIRQELTLRALGAEVPLREISLLDFNAPNAVVTGTVRGTPIVAANAYLASSIPSPTTVSTANECVAACRGRFRSGPVPRSL